MKKEDRCKVNEVYVCGFVPNHMLPNKCAILLDPFLQILVEEIEDLFVNGKEIYPIHVHAYSICYMERSIRKWVLWILFYNIKFKSIYLPKY